MEAIKVLLGSIVIIGSILFFSGVDNVTPTTEMLQDVSVMIHGSPDHKGNGSGTLVCKPSGLQYVITAFHVIDELKKKDGTFDQIPVSQRHLQNGVTVGHTEYLTELVRYSVKRDIAVLHVLKTSAYKTGARFAGNSISIGSPIRHVGCFHGEGGYNSYSEGVISQTGRTVMGGNHLQISAAHYPGSSGGGVFNWDGEYIGMVLMRHDSTMGLANPIGELRVWANQAGLDWLFTNGDYSASIDAIKKLPLNIE